MAIGAAGALIALALLRLIGFFTNLPFFGRWSTALVSPAGGDLGVWAVLVPVAGALVVGLMARYGSDSGLTRFPVVAREDRRRLLGMVALTDLLTARVRVLEAERRRERILRIRLVLPTRKRPAA